MKTTRWILWFVILFAGGCVTSNYQEVIKHDAWGGPSEYEVAVGDKVKVITKDNEQYEFIVEEVTETGITGPNFDVDFESMESLEVWKVNVDESIEKGVMGTFYTTQVIMGILVIIALVAL